MKTLIIGTRGSDLALWQASYIAHLLNAATGVATSFKVIQTESDLKPDQPITPDDWPTGGFTSALEDALLAGEVDVAVHSLKDLPTQSHPEVIIAAMPERGPVHDVILAHSAQVAADIRLALKGTLPTQPIRLGTSSPRRAWQGERLLGCVPHPIRGNVPTRISKLLSGQYDAICLAAAGIFRLGLSHDHRIDLPLDRFPTAAGQGAIAVQVRYDAQWKPVVQAIDHAPTRNCVLAERTFLHAMNAGCHAPLAASASLLKDQVRLHVQMKMKSGECFEQVVTGSDPEQLGREFAEVALRAEASS